ncbi:hypothetical protein C8R43DRAFT_663384 [Mycena crocata]|nr:hypothetical protein C8R43DRAFT_663384 [Mycena crocata]
MTILFLDLPSEILVLIFHSLDLPTLSHCLSTNRRLKSLIDGSASLRYRWATLAACVEDNPSNAANSAHRLDVLQKREHSFTKLLSDFICSITIPDEASSYTLSGDIFAHMTDSERQCLIYTVLPSTLEQKIVWERFEIEESILQYALAVPEDDLLVILSSSADETVHLRFYEMSTRAFHRNAQSSVLHVPEFAAFEDCEFSVELCGSKVGLLVEFMSINNDPHLQPPNRLFVYDWKEGRLQMDINGDYTAAIFLSSDIILLVCAETGNIELWNIPDSLQRMSPGPEITLKLPRLKTGSKYWAASIESNPKGGDSSNSMQPFRSSFTDSVLVLSLDIEADIGDALIDMLLVIRKHAILLQLPSVRDGFSEAKERAWAEWGPPISRWLEGNMFTIGPMMTCGQRCSLRDSSSGSVVLYDFNAWTYQKMLLQQTEELNYHTSTNQATLVGAPSRNQFTEMGIFDEEVDSHLGYVATQSERQNSYSGILISEAYILGLNIEVNLNSPVPKSLDVWHFG